MLRYRILNRIMIIVLLMTLLPACAVNELRTGQDYFSEAASIENRALFSSLAIDSPDAGPGDVLAALSKYRTAESKLKKQLENEEAQLKEDKLYGTTYILLAMTQWRISDLEGNKLSDNENPSKVNGMPVDKSRRQTLLSTINIINENKEKWTLGTRDRVLSHALYGFYDHDGGRMAADYEKAGKWFKSALERYDEAINKNDVPLNHSIRVYIAMAKLRTLAAWTFAADANGQDDDQQVINEAAKSTLCAVQHFYNTQNGLKSKLELLLAEIGVDMPSRGYCETIH